MNRLITIDKGTTNSGDEYIQTCFDQEFSEFNFKKIWDAHTYLTSSQKSDLSTMNKVVMTSSNLLPYWDAKAPKLKCLWRLDGYDYKNIIPVSIGTNKLYVKLNARSFTKIKSKFIILLLKIKFLKPLYRFLAQKVLYRRSIAHKTLKNAIDMNAPISTRTKAAEEYLLSLGAKDVTTTGCVTIWGFDRKVIESVSDTKKENLLLAFTIEPDDLKEKVIAECQKYYKNVIVWHQSYYHAPPNLSVEVLSNDWDELSRLSSSGDWDYIGSRLHAGIAFLKSGGRGLFIAIDHRVVNYSKILGIKYYEEKSWMDAVTKESISDKWCDKLKPIDRTKIELYKNKLKNYLK